MLQSMRDNLKGAVAYFIVGLITLVFILSYVDAFVQGRLQQNAVASVNGVDITERDLVVAIAARKQQLINMLGEQLDPKFLSDESLREPVLQELIQRRLMESAAKDSDLAVATAVIDKQIVETPAFQKEGKFDSKHYTDLLARYGYTPASYRQELIDNYLMVQYQNTFARTGFVTEREKNDMASLMYQTRSFDLVTLPIANALAQTTVSEEEINTYYTQHPEAFMTELLRAAEYIEIRKADLLQDVVITNEDIRAQYDAEVEAAADQTERHAAHILVEEKPDGSHQATLDTIQQRLAKGDAFESLASTYSADAGSASTGGDVGTTTGSSFVPEFEEALKKLSAGEISKPVKTEFGYHIIKLLGLKTKQPASFEASRTRIEKELRSQQADELYAEQVELMRDARSSSSGMSDVASAISADKPPAIKRLELSSRQALMMKLRDPAVVEALFTEDLATGDMTDVLELDGGERAMVLRVSENKMPEVKPLEQVHAQATESARRHKALESLRIQASAILARVNTGETLDAIARSEKLSFRAANDKQRMAGDVDVEILNRAFEMPVPADAATPGVVTHELQNGDHAVIVLRAVHVPASDEMTPEQKASVDQRISSSLMNREQLALQALLESQGKLIKRQTATP